MVPAVHPLLCHDERLRYHVASLVLCSQASDSGLVVQRSAGVDSQASCPWKRAISCFISVSSSIAWKLGDCERHVLCFYFKEFILSCLTNTGPPYQDLAQESDDDAQFFLPLQCESSYDSTERELAVKWFKCAAEQGCADAQEGQGNPPTSDTSECGGQ